MKPSLFTAVATASLLVATQSVQAQEGVSINATAVTDNIYMLTGKGGNIGLLTGKDGSFIIDDQFAPLTEKILKTIESVGGETPKFLINTHYHGDHTGGNENFGNKGTLIVSHDNVRQRLLDGSFIQTFNKKTPPAKQVALPVVTFSDNMHFHINDETVKAIHVPNAHTDGDSIIHFKGANVVHAGDIFFNGFYPFIDVDHGGSLKGTIDATDIILSMTDSNSKIIPGHGQMANKAQLQAYRDMLNTAYIRLSKFKKQGVGLEDVVAIKPLADLEPKWGKGIFTGDKWIGIVYSGLN